MIVKLLTEHHLEFLSLKGGCRGSSESTLVKTHIVGNLMHWLKCNTAVIETKGALDVSNDTSLQPTSEREATFTTCL